MNSILYVGTATQGQEADWHSHSHWKLVYCAAGEGAFRLESGLTVSYHRGEAAAIPPGEAYRSAGGPGLATIHLTMEAPAFPYKSAFVVADDEQGHMGAAFEQARYYYASDLKRHELVLAALGELITSYMIVFRDNREFSVAVEDIRSSIIRNFANPAFQLDQEIRQMPFNYDYLRKLFQKEMGQTPLKYMIDLRMKKAKSMLAAAWTREYSVAEVAESCGFGDALYFSRVFKKYYGCSPTEFVKRRREEAQRAAKLGDIQFVNK